jgi:hypothetical protein
MSGHDRDLQEYFAALRREEESLVPPLSSLSRTANGRGRRKRTRRLIVAIACLATMIAAAVWLLPGSRLPHGQLNQRRGQAVASITSWKPATDFLLNTPGRELLQGVPVVGDWRGAAIAPRAGERHRHLKKQVLP